MRHRRIYLGLACIGVLLVLLVAVQIGWLQQVRTMERKDADTRIIRAMDKTARQLEARTNCIEGYSKAFISDSDRLMIVRSRWDSVLHAHRPDTLTIIYNPGEYYPDTAILTDKQAAFHMPILAELQLNMHVAFNDSDQRMMQQSGGLDTVRAKTYREAILSRLGIQTLLNAGSADSFLRANLAAAHITDTAFGYGFTDATKSTAEFTSRITDTGALLASPYQVMLFTNNQFLEPHRFAVVFKGTNSSGGFLWWLLLSVGIIMLLSLSFLLFVRLFIRQSRLSQMKTDFINNLTHEFNTPMANIALAVETINDSDNRPPKLARLLSIISSEAYRLRENIERALEVATLEKGSLRLRREQVDIVALINTVIPGFQSQCEELGGDISFRYSGNAIVYGDEVHLLNSICNLLDNAIRYRRGTPRICIEVSGGTRNVMLQITDNGIGMTAETQRHIFEKFYRAHQGDLHNTKGFGLGLNYVKGILALHGGSISVRSKPDKGSTFTIQLPNADETVN